MVIMGNKSKEYRITERDYIKAVRKADRENEIEIHGKLISLVPSKVHKSKKGYNRKKFKKSDFDY